VAGLERRRPAVRRPRRVDAGLPRGAARRPHERRRCRPVHECHDGTAATDLLDLLAETEPHAPEPWSADSTQADDVALTGEWFWGTQSFTLVLQPDDGLRLGTPGDGRGARFVRSGDGWVGLEGYYAGEPLTVRRDDDGRPVQLDLASFVFTRTPYDPAADVPGGLEPDGWR
jgi:hypothetical protein